MIESPTATRPVAGELLRVHPADPDYRRLAEAEARFWDVPHPCGIEALWERMPDQPTDRYVNERYTGDPALRWEETVCRYGDFRRGLALGTSGLDQEARLLATNPRLHLTFVDLSPGAVERRRERLGARFPGRVDGLVADLNFLELAPGSYDLIVSASTVHHVTNLEHLAWQIDRALTRDGFAFLQDYVGESRFRFAPGKRRLFEVIWYREALRSGLRPGVVWHDDSDLSPFCGVRSHEILDTFRRFLDEEELRTAGTLLVPVLRHTPIDAGPGPAPRVPLLRRLRDRIGGRSAGPRALFLRELMSVGDAASDAGLLIPGNAFVRYRKRGRRGA
jgi:SAM-dependent methyltransferase